MAIRKSIHRQLTERDLNVLTALYQSPLTATQMLRLSVIWHQPFQSLRRAQARLRDLELAGIVRSWPYATTRSGNSHRYYKLSRTGFAVVFDDAPLPTKRFLNEIAIGRHRHTTSLSDLIVQMQVAAHGCEASITEFYPENSRSIPVGDSLLYPDASLTLVTKAGAAFPVHVELDNCTETVCSEKAVESITRKIRLYVEHERQTRSKSRVLFVTTGTDRRLDSIFAVASVFAFELPYQLFYGTCLKDYLAASNPLTGPCFRTTRESRAPLIRPRIHPVALGRVPEPLAPVAIH